MADFLALDWDEERLFALEARQTRSSVRVGAAHLWEWPEGLNIQEQPEKAGQWLKEQLVRAGAGQPKVLLSLPRESVVVRQLELPAGPEEELADIVRMQAATKSSLPLDQLLLDFLPLPPREDASGRDVLMVTIARKTADRIRTVIETAGLELESIGISPVATAELVARVERKRGHAPADTSLIIARHGHRVELSIMSQQRLLFLHSTRLSEEDQEQDNRSVLSEVQRSIVAVRRIQHGVTIARAWVCGTDSENGLLVDMLRERLSCEVLILDPVRDLALDADAAGANYDGTPFAIAAGTLLGRTDPNVQSIDLLNPRRTPVKPDRRKLKASVAAGALAAAALVGGVLLWSHLKDLDRQLADRRQQESDVDQLVKRGQPQIGAEQALSQWEEGQVNWLAQMTQFQQALPGTDRVYLTKYSTSPSTGQGMARIMTTLHARTRNDAELVAAELYRENYRVLPSAITQGTTRDAEYPFQYILTADLLPPDEPEPPAAAPAGDRTSGLPSSTTPR